MDQGLESDYDADKAREAVARGAALLDTVRPGWMHILDIEKLRMESCEACICGQLFGRFGSLAMTAAFGLMTGDQYGIFVLNHGFAYGFAESWDHFRDLWIEEIRLRLAS